MNPPLGRKAINASKNGGVKEMKISKIAGTFIRKSMCLSTKKFHSE